MTDIREPKIVLLCPEEWDRIKPFAPTQHVACGGLSLAFGHDPVFHADGLAGKSIRPACDVPGREDARRAGLQVFVYSDATVDGETGLFRQSGHRPHADADDNEVGRDTFSVLQR